MLTILQKIRQDKRRMHESEIFPIIALAIVLAIYAIIVHDRAMPFSEGWYTYYAQCINNGLIPYRDFSYLFSPLYLYTIATFTDVFGYEIIKLRILGIVFFIIIGIGVYVCLRLVFPKWVSVISSITATLYLQTEPAQVYYDYVRLMDIFSIFTTFFLMLTVKRIVLNKKYDYCVFVAGILNGAFILVKQNMGLIYLAFAIIALCVICFCLKINKKEITRILFIYLLALIIPIIITASVLYSNGSLKYFIKNTGSEALAAKGGLKAVLFNWWVNCFPEFYRAKNKLLFTLVSLLGLVFLSYSPRIKIVSNRIKKITLRLYKKNCAEDCIFNTICTFAFIFSVSVLAVLMKNNFELSKKIYIDKNISPYLVFLIATSLLLYYLFSIVAKTMNKESHLDDKSLLSSVMLGAYFAISYGCGTSGGLAEGQAPLGLSFCISILLLNTNIKYIGCIIRLLLISFCLFISIQAMDKKMLYTYNWWGADESSFWDSKYETIVPILKGIKVSDKTKYIYDGIYQEISDNTTKYDNIVCFPHIPIFYVLTDRKDPGLYSKVQWFDVVSDKYIKNDIKKVKISKPKYIVIYNTGEFAYFMHEKLFRGGATSGTRIMRNELWEMVSKDYLIVDEFTSNNNIIDVFKRR